MLTGAGRGWGPKGRWSCLLWSSVRVRTATCEPRAGLLASSSSSVKRTLPQTSAQWTRVSGLTHTQIRLPPVDSMLRPPFVSALAMTAVNWPTRSSRQGNVGSFLKRGFPLKGVTPPLSGPPSPGVDGRPRAETCWPAPGSNGLILLIPRCEGQLHFD